MDVVERSKADTDEDQCTQWQDRRKGRIDGSRQDVSATYSGITGTRSILIATSTYVTYPDTNTYIDKDLGALEHIPEGAYYLASYLHTYLTIC